MRHGTWLVLTLATASCILAREGTLDQTQQGGGTSVGGAGGIGGESPCPSSCTPYVCDAASASCLTACTGNEDCAAGFVCEGTVCVASKNVGESCDSPGQCGTGLCVDGVCCTSACSGACESCNALGFEGTCHPAEAASDPGGHCAPGVCDGAGSCAIGSFGWLAIFGNDSQDLYVEDVAFGASQVAAVGRFRDPVDFGGGLRQSEGGRYDLFAARWSEAGAFIDDRTAGNGSQDQFGNGIAIDPTGRVIVAGRFRDEVDFGAGGIGSAGGRYDAFVASYDALGALSWIVTIGNGAQDQDATDVAVDPAGNVYLAGHFRGVVDFGNGMEVASVGAKHDAFLAKYDAGGALLWVKRFGNGAQDQFTAGVAADASGAVLTGRFRGSVDFGGGMVSSLGGKHDVFVASFTSGGAHRWTDTFGDGANDQFGLGVSIDAFGEVIAVGQYISPSVTGCLPASHGGAYDGFVAKYSSTGTCRWGHALGNGTIAQHLRAAASDGAANVIVAGAIMGSVDFDGLALASAGAKYDAFVAKLDAEGTLLWEKRYGNGLQDQEATAVAVNDHVAVAGRFRAPVDFGGGPVDSIGAKHAGFVLLLAP